jgi:hypothetical protein
MGKMMDRALQAQEAQKAAQEESRSPEGGTPTRDLGQATKPINSSSTRPERTRDGASTARVRSKASEQHIHVVSTDTVKYASDIKSRGSNGNGNGNGYASMNGKTTQLPSKRRNKK